MAEIAGDFKLLSFYLRVLVTQNKPKVALSKILLSLPGFAANRSVGIAQQSVIDI
jgi:hypothetical protein